MHEGLFQAINSVLAIIVRVRKKLVPDQLLLVLGVLLHAIGDNHVIDTLKGVAKYRGRLADQFQVFSHCAFPVKFLVGTIPSVLLNEFCDFCMIRHGFTSHFSVQADRIRVGGPLRGKRDGDYDPRFYLFKTAKWGQHAVGISMKKRPRGPIFWNFPLMLEAILMPHLFLWPNLV